MAITYRLADSLPEPLLAAWREALQATSHSPELDLRRRIEVYLDRGSGVDWLRNPRVAAIVEQAFLHFDGERYRLHAWVVMPNHVHVLISPMETHAISEIVHTWKSFSAHRAAKVLKRPGRFWQPDYFDRTIRDEKHFGDAKAYIENNPVKAKLCSVASEWAFSSAAWAEGNRAELG